MLLAKDFRVPIAEKPSPPPIGFPRAPVNVGMRSAAGSAGGRSSASDEDCRICASAVPAALAAAAAGGGAGDLAVRGFSHESEHDLAIMVSDFLENGSSGAESWYSSDSESGFSDLHHLAERVLFWKRTVEQSESDLLSVVQSLIPSIKETDLEVVNDGQCNGSCIRQSLARLLRISGYDAAVCSSKWQGVGKIPGGDHEYIDVVIPGTKVSERLIIDIDFQSHFEIARAVESYEALLFSLPAVYVGSLERLKQFLQIMAEATRFSLKQNSMPLPPWRSLSYLQAKWHSPYERKTDVVERIHYYYGGDSIDHDQCIGHLRRLKASLWEDIDPERHFKHQITNEKKRRLKFDRVQRPSLLRS